MLAAGVLIHMEKSALAVITILPMTMTLVDAKLFPVYMLIWLMVGFSLTAYADSWLCGNCSAHILPRMTGKSW